MIPYQEHLQNITSQENEKRKALESAIDKAYEDANQAGHKRFSVPIPPETPEEIVRAVKEYYERPPFSWPVRISHDQREGNTMYFGSH